MSEAVLETTEREVAEVKEAESKAEEGDFSGLYKKMLIELDGELSSEWRRQLGRIRCERCAKAVLELGCGSFVYCSDCTPPIYYCSECKAHGRSAHESKDHCVSWKPVSATRAPLRARCSSLVAKGAAFQRVASKYTADLTKSAAPSSAAAVCHALEVGAAHELSMSLYSDGSKMVLSFAAESGKELVLTPGLSPSDWGVEMLEGGLRAGRKLLWKGPLKALPKVKHAGAIVPLSRAAYDLVTATWQWYNEVIGWNELLDTAKGTVLRNTGLFAGSLLGKKMGAAAGFYCFGPVGALIGGFVGAAAGGFAGERFGREMSPEMEEKAKAQALKEAAEHFNFTPLSALDDARKFNYVELRKRWKQRCLELHPDRATGCEQRFKTMNFYYGVLLSYLDKRAGGYGIIVRQTIKDMEICLD